MRISLPFSPTGSALAAGTATFALLVGGLASPAQALSPYAPAPLKDGATWLAGQTAAGLVHNAQYDFDDYGLSVDVALGLDAAGKKDEVVRSITKAVAKHVGAYTTFGASVYAGATAKALTLALQRGKDPKSFGGVDLLTQLEGRVAPSAPITGRIEDAFDPADPAGGDYANIIGQAYAAEALTLAKGPEAAAATSFLLDQQCQAGFFRLSFTADKTAADQTCDGGSAKASAPDTDTTAIAALALFAMPARPRLAKALDKAIAWLLDAQHADGSFGGGTSTEAANTNSTGLAGWAIGMVGDTGDASRAAAWVRHLQVGPPNPCSGKLATQAGAVAYDLDAYEAGLTSGIRNKTSDQWRRASAQALPVLRWAPRSEQSFAATGPAGAVAAGSSFRIALTGVAPGQRVCVVRGGSALEFVPGRRALTKITLVAPDGAGTRSYQVYVGDQVRSVTVRVSA